MYYVMLSRRKLGRVKIGYSNAPTKRKEQVRADIVIPFAVPFESWSQPIESILHIIFAWSRSKERKSDGSTEWFYCFNIVAPMVCYNLDLPFWWLAFVPLPFDIFAACVLMMLASFGVIVAVAVSIVFIFSIFVN